MSRIWVKAIEIRDWINWMSHWASKNWKLEKNIYIVNSHISHNLWVLDVLHRPNSRCIWPLWSDKTNRGNLSKLCPDWDWPHSVWINFQEVLVEVAKLWTHPPLSCLFCLNKKAYFNFKVVKLYLTKQLSSKNYS